MSVVFIITPVLIGGWSILGALISTTAGVLGYKLLKRTQKEKEEGRLKTGIELNDEKSQVIGDELKPEEELVFVREGITLSFKKDLRGKLAICVNGENKTKEELETAGKMFLNKIKQQYAYQKVVNEMTKRGFNLVEEKKEGQRIKILLRKF